MTRHLDSIARWILTNCDVPVLSIIFICVLVSFCSWRRLRYKLWPSQKDYFDLTLSLISMMGSITVALVFLFTKPPAVHLLDGATLLFLGLVVPIVVIGTAFPQLKALFLPTEAPKPRDTQRPEDNLKV
jgi:hypothetical protein